MDRRHLVIPDLQPAGLPDPSKGALDHIADLAQAAAVRCPLPRQVVLDATLLEALAVAGGAVLPVPVQRLRLPPPAAALAADRRDVLPEAHRPPRLPPRRGGAPPSPPGGAA